MNTDEQRSDVCEGCNTEMCWCRSDQLVNGQCGGACHTGTVGIPDCRESFTLAQGDNVIGFACELRAIGNESGDGHLGDHRRTITVDGVVAEMSWRSTQ